MTRRQIKTIKDKVLGKRYDLSVAFLTPKKMRALTRATLGKNKVSNVLSFPLSKNSGEILICKQARKPYTIEYLFIHGALHLKGLKHGGTMEREENRILVRFGFRRNA